MTRYIWVVLFVGMVIGLESESHLALQDKEEYKEILYQHGETQNEVFLIELEDEDFHDVGIHAFTDCTSIATLAVEPSCEDSVDGGKEGYSLIAEVLKEGLKDSIDVGEHGDLSELLKLRLNDIVAQAESCDNGIEESKGPGTKLLCEFFLYLLKSYGRGKNIDVEEIHEGSFSDCVLRGTHLVDAIKCEQQDDGPQGDSANLDMFLFVKNEQGDEEHEEQRTFFHDGYGAHEIGKDNGTETQLVDLGITPHLNDKQSLVNGIDIGQKSLNHILLTGIGKDTEIEKEVGGTKEGNDFIDVVNVKRSAYQGNGEEKHVEQIVGMYFLVDVNVLTRLAEFSA